jgi:hypothetical protein
MQIVCPEGTPRVACIPSKSNPNLDLSWINLVTTQVTVPTLKGVLRCTSVPLDKLRELTGVLSARYGKERVGLVCPSVASVFQRQFANTPSPALFESCAIWQTLYTYQKDTLCYAWVRRKALLALDMGCGLCDFPFFLFFLDIRFGSLLCVIYDYLCIML